MLKPIFCYVTDRRKLETPAGADAQTVLIDRIRSAAVANVDWIQLREKDLDTGPLLTLARAAIAATTTSGKSQREAEAATRILINDRLDVAWAARAGGVHLRETSAPVDKVVREACSWKRESGCDRFLVGVSCHSLDGARQAELGGASYIFFGPVFATPSKSAFGAPVGIARLAEVCRSVRIPVLAIGGITAMNAQYCFGSGASGIAAIRLFQESQDLPELLARLRG